MGISAGTNSSGNTPVCLGGIVDMLLFSLPRREGFPPSPLDILMRTLNWGDISMMLPLIHIMMR